MTRLPRWRFMTDEAKALTKRVAVSAVVLLVALVLLRALLPWVVLGLIVWWVWKALSKSVGSQRRTGLASPGRITRPIKKRTRPGPPDDQAPLY